ncbi:MAG TPA: hypothetical protein VMW57_00490 [Methyloceanibacter sp.]|nr:hypothetical protein [Methyloceanibacter sp.]
MWWTMSNTKTGTAAFIKREENPEVLDREARLCEAAIHGMENGHRRVLGPNFGGDFPDECRLYPQNTAANG